MYKKRGSQQIEAIGHSSNIAYLFHNPEQQDVLYIWLCHIVNVERFSIQLPLPFAEESLGMYNENHFFKKKKKF